MNTYSPTSCENEEKRNKLLLVSFHFPPIQGSSGFNRPLSFAKFLPENGWDVAVLTVEPTAYADSRAENLNLIPKTTKVYRSYALDSRRHLSFKKKYISALTIPDRWQTWIVTGTLKGICAYFRFKPKVILTTYPIASAHCIGLILSKLTGMPLVADFRDPMAQDTWPPSNVERKIYKYIERKVFERASIVLVTTRSTFDYYAERYREHTHKIKILTNGFDADNFKNIKKAVQAESSEIKLLHSGLLSTRDRNPIHLLKALADLNSNKLIPSNFTLTLRASGLESEITKETEHLGLSQVVKVLPSISYTQALEEMCSADGLLLLQGETCDRQIPAKLYEYMYTGRPILGLVSRSGDAAAVLKEVECLYIAQIDDVDSIKSMFLRFFIDLKNKSTQGVKENISKRYERESIAVDLAKILNNIVNK